MNIAQFVKAIGEADLELLCSDRLDELFEYIDERLAERGDNIIIRCLMEDESLVPFYVWVVFKIFHRINDDELGVTPSEIYIPEEGKFEMYLNPPEVLEGEKYFDVFIQDGDSLPL